MRAHPSAGPSCLAVAMLATAVAFAAQAVTVHINYGDRWSALFYHGHDFPAAPLVSAENVYLFPGTGYDGQIYHLMAHDPIFRSGLSRYIDDPRLRYRRILVPALAYALALGHHPAVDVCYHVVILAFLALGTYWLSALAVRKGRKAWWGLWFMSFPAVFVSLERSTVDIALVALTVGFALYSEDRATIAFLTILALAGLVRETGLLLPMAYLIRSAWHAQWRGAVLSVLAMAPAAIWFAFVNAHTVAQHYPQSFVPLKAILHALIWQSANPASRPTIAALFEHGAEMMALGGMILAIGLSFAALRRGPRGPLEIAAGLFALLALFIQRQDNWLHVYDYGRVYSPLLALLAIRSLVGSDSNRLGLLPTATMWPRLLLQVRTQIGGVGRAVAGRLM
jgi:hypothetical protein